MMSGVSAHRAESGIPIIALLPMSRCSLDSGPSGSGYMAAAIGDSPCIGRCHIVGAMTGACFKSHSMAHFSLFAT